jgi:hypothetical protein
MKPEDDLPADQFYQEAVNKKRMLRTIGKMMEGRARNPGT